MLKGGKDREWRKRSIGNHVWLSFALTFICFCLSCSQAGESGLNDLPNTTAVQLVTINGFGNAHFTRVLSSSGPPQSLRVSESDDSIVEARDDRLFRIRRGQKTEIRSTSPAGTGTIRALVADPWGATFIAADNGIFLLSPDVDVSDALKLGEEAPPGRPLALHLDEKRRLWILTDRAFGCLSTVFFYGRTVAEGDELRSSGPIYRDKVDGALILKTGAKRDFYYRPDSGLLPTVSITAINGHSYVPGSVMKVGYPGKVILSMYGTAAGGATFRYRIDDHHGWLPVAGSTAVIRGLAPGRHKIRVIALDRDLNVSEPATVMTNIGWPIYYQSSFVLSAGFTIALLVSSIFFFPAWKRGGGRIAYARAAISTILILVVGLQIIAGLIPHARGWPFVGFSMYTNSHVHDEITGPLVLEGITPTGARRHIHATETGITAYKLQVLPPLINGNERVRRAFVEAYNKQYGAKAIVGFEVRRYRYRLTEDGPVKVAPIVMARFVEGRPNVDL